MTAPTATSSGSTSSISPNVHQSRDGLAGLAYGIVLEQLAYLVEQHNEHSLGVFGGGEGAHSGQGHQEILVKDLPVFDIADRFIENIPANDGIGRQVTEGGQQTLLRQDGQGAQHLDEDQQRCRDGNAPDHFLLFF